MWTHSQQYCGEPGRRQHLLVLCLEEIHNSCAFGKSCICQWPSFDNFWDLETTHIPKDSYLLWLHCVFPVLLVDVHYNKRLHRDHRVPGIFRISLCLDHNPTSVISFGRNPFIGSSKLEVIDVSENLNFVFADGVLMDENETLIIYSFPLKLGVCKIPETVMAVSAGAFYECTELISVTIP